MPGDADAAADFALTPPEEQLLALIRDGRVDAEIAVRLSISNAEVKERIERLVSKLGVKDRAALRDGAAREEPPPPFELSSAPVLSRWRYWHIAAALAIGVVIGVAATTFALHDDGSSAGGPAVLPGDPHSPGALNSSFLATALAPSTFGWIVLPTPSPMPSPAPTPRVTTVNGRRMLDAGKLFGQVGQPTGIESSEARESLLVVTLTEPNAFVFDNGFAKWSLSGTASPKYNPVLVGTVGDQAYTLRLFTAGKGTAFLPGDANSLGIYSQGEAPPAVILWVDGHHAEVGSDGHLYIEADPIPKDKAVALDTGEDLFVERLPRRGPIDGAWTLCDGYWNGECVVIARPPRGPEYAPVSGTLVCRPTGILELATATFRLEFNRLDSSGADAPSCDGFSATPIQVARGEILSNAPYHYRIEAFALDGRPLDVAVAGDGTLYVGDIGRAFGCPCRGGT